MGKLPLKRRKSKKTRRPPRYKYTLYEDALLIRLKEEQQLPWDEIHRRFCKEFPEAGRNIKALQGRYWRRLRRGSDDPGSEQHGDTTSIDSGSEAT
jgi:hypothetical protein